MKSAIHLPYITKNINIFKSNLWNAVIFLAATLLSSCTVFQTKSHDTTGDAIVQLNVSSLHAKKIQEKGLLGSDSGDELALVYAIQAYDKEGQLTSVNNGLWGIRETQQDALILSDQFSKLEIPAYNDGRLLIAFSLIEIDDYKGERKMAKVRNYTKSVRFPKMLSVSSFEEDQNLPPLELIAKSFKIAGYKHFKTKQMDVSTNDELGSTKQAFSETELNAILKGTKSVKETYQMDGSNVNEDYLYVLKYNLQPKRTGK